MSKPMAVGRLMIVTFGTMVSPVVASDPENCLWCHGLLGLGWIDSDTGELRLFSCGAEYDAGQQGPHTGLACSDCHAREEVEVVPHRVRTRVDCTRACHVVRFGGIEVPFSHRRVAEHLAASAHDPDALADLPFDPPLLREGQSACLYCHDQPLFRGPAGTCPGSRWSDEKHRCGACHGEELPVDVDYHVQHVMSRLQSARPVRQLAQACAVCHSDPGVIARIGGHDTVASYLHSFHGKASLLGSTETANCVDCHASDTGDAHAMLGKEHPASSVHESRLAATCRTAHCHAGASPRMSRAAVHLDLDPQARTPEFYVAGAFIILTAAVMSVFFLLIALQLLNVVIRRRKPEHERLVRLARELQRTPEGRRRLERTSPHHRVQHWGLAITFILLVATGMPIKFADAPWASKMIALLGGLPFARRTHRISAVVMMAVFLYHLGYLAVCFARHVQHERPRGSRRSVPGAILSAPIMLRPGDFLEFARRLAYLLFLRREPPTHGRFNFIQKFEYWAVFWGIPVMGLSGLALWGAARTAEHISGRGLNFAYIIHSDEAYLAFVYIAVVHTFSVILAPRVFPLSPAMLTGQARAAELAAGQRELVESAGRELGVSADATPSGGASFRKVAGQVVRRAYAAGLLCACVAVCFISMRFLFTLLVTRQTAPIEVVGIPKRLDLDSLATFAPAPSGPHAETGTKPRGPLAHFHHVTSWPQPDTNNNCTTSGCHTPLPHRRRIETRAFLNMHTTFMDCCVCHDNRMLGELTEAQRTAAARYRQDLDSLSANERQSLLKVVHNELVSEGAACTACHSAEPGRIDLAELGYPQARVEALQSSPIVRQVLRIESGQPFYLPRLLEAGRAE